MQQYHFTVTPAGYMNLGTHVEKDSILFSVVLRGSKSCGLCLYHLPDLYKITIPFTDEHRNGDLYSVRIKGIRPAEWAYAYYREEELITDPFARELTEVVVDEKPVLLGRFFSLPEAKTCVKPDLAPLHWQDEVLYCMHVKGMTASKTSRVNKKGTYAALEKKILHLQKLGVTAIELLPTYELRPEKKAVRTAAAGNDSASVSVPGFSEKLTDSIVPEKVNYWNFGQGFYFAPKEAYAAGNSAAREFYHMIETMHDAGIRVIMQLYFPDSVSIQTQLETARFYAVRYHVDGFHLKGVLNGLMSMTSDPVLSDSIFISYDFPYQALTQENKENPEMGIPSVYHLAEATDDYEFLLRRFVKSDDLVMRDFIREFVRVDQDHGRIRYVTNYEGFTLMDLVSYNHKHNEANGEDNRDGNDYNCSWNCGEEGPVKKKEIRQIRLCQIRNFLTLLFLSQGTPMLTAGDEMGNSQEGNNNPYCQDNELGWVNWKSNAENNSILSFTQKICAFRKSHKIFRAEQPFKMSDTLSCGFPDLSFHGEEAWKPDLGGYSHTIGLCYCENYADPAQNAENTAVPDLLYLGINMHWHRQELGLPIPPVGYEWKIIMDTNETDSFHEEPVSIQDQQHLRLHGRTIQILKTFPKEQGQSVHAKDPVKDEK